MTRTRSDLEYAYSLLEEDLRREDGVALLCGSGISVAPPSCIPSGMDVASAFQQTIEECVSIAGLEGLGDWDFVGEMMPERIMSAFYAVFGWSVFEFMDPWFQRVHNRNHRALAEFIRHGRISRVVNLNFDFLLEDALGRPERPEVLSPAGALVGEREEWAWLLKPHGTLRADQRESPGSERYRDILFTIERIGTALDDELASRLAAFLGPRPLLVTGYSAGDLDIFPAVREAIARVARQHGARAGRVYWNYRSASKMAKTPELEGWLGSLVPQWCPVPGDIEDHLAELRVRLGLPPDVGGESEGEDSRSEPQLKNLPQLAEDPPGVLLAAALVLHAANQAQQHRVETEILRRLGVHRPAWIAAGQYRKATMFAQLTADRMLEQGNFRTATTWYREAAHHAAAHSGEEPIAAEVLPQDIRCKIAHAQLRPLRSLLPILRPLTTRRAYRTLLATARGATTKAVGTRRLAAHFLGGLFYTMGMQFEAVFFIDWLARRLYGSALVWFESSVRREGTWRAKDAFHHLRLEEVRLLMRHLDGPHQHLGKEVEVDEWDRRFRQVAYAAEVLKDDVHLSGAVCCVAALRDVVFSRAASGQTRMRLADAMQLYRTRQYGAGVVRLQLYVWLCSPRPPRVAMPVVAARRWWRLAMLRLCPWCRAARKLSEEIEGLPDSMTKV